jgi:hypothetical protein
MVEHGAHHARGSSATCTVEEDQGLAGGRTEAEHVAFSFMKRMVQLLMARHTLGYQYTGNEYNSGMPGEEIEDEVIIERLGRIF